jgi:hypothetical protein
VSLAAGARLGPYEVLATLGAGGMGEVYRALDPRLGREVAIKVLPDDVASDPDRLRRFEREARAVAALSHPNIVAVYDVGSHEGVPYVVSELLDGETLRARLASPLPLRKVIELAASVATGLAAAHERLIVHRDLKPENLFVTRDGRAKILDFGLAKLLETPDVGASGATKTAAHATEAGTVLGTVGYMSPEQVRGREIDHRSDIFSFGLVLYEMLAGRRAFQGETAAETMTAILREDPPALQDLKPELPPALVRIVSRCLEKRPEDRFQSARDLAFALETVTGTQRQVLAVRGPSGRTLRVAGVVAGVLAAAAAGWHARGIALPQAPELSFTQLTMRAGPVWNAVFAPDGQTILLSAAWDGQPTGTFSTRIDSRGDSRSLGLRDSVVMDVSSRGEVAVLVRSELTGWGVHQGTLSRMALAGGDPREILDDVQDASFSPDGATLAVTHWVEGRIRLEYPIGKVLYAPPPPVRLAHMQLSPDGERMAFFEHPVAGEDRGSLVVVDRGGARTVLAADLTTSVDLAWMPSGREILFTGARGSPTPREIRAVTLDGRERVVHRPPGVFRVMDIARDGRLIGTGGHSAVSIVARVRGAAEERDVTSRDFTFLTDLSPDGQVLVGTDEGESGGPNHSVRLWRTDGTESTVLGDGDAQSLTPDGRFVLTHLLHTTPEQLVLLPTGAGDTRLVPGGGIQHYVAARCLPDGRRIVFEGSGAGLPHGLYIQALDEPQGRPISPEGATLPPLGNPGSGDGRHVVGLDPEGVPTLYALDGGPPRPVPGLLPGDLPIGWTSDNRHLYFVQVEDDFASVQLVDLAGGEVRPFKVLASRKPPSMVGRFRVLVAPDGQSYAYSSLKITESLMVVEGLR